MTPRTPRGGRKVRARRRETAAPSIISAKCQFALLGKLLLYVLPEHAMNNRKVVDISTGHYSRSDTAQRKLIDDAAPKSENVELKKVPKKFLRDDCAIQQYKRLAKILTRDALAGDADKNNLIAYCNAWSVYIETQRDMDDPEKVLYDSKEEGARQDRLFRRNSKALDTMSIYGNKLGMSISARLQRGAEIVKQKQEKIEEKFGAI